MAKVLVTGGTGFIGASLSKRLVKEGYEVISLDNNSRGSLKKFGTEIDGVTFVEGDIRDVNSVIKAGRDCIHTYHLAYVNGTENFYKIPDVVLEVAVKGAINTLEGAIENGHGKYILASSSEVYNEPNNIPTDETEKILIPDIQNPRFSYSGGKIISELLTINYSRNRELNGIIFRPHNVYGPDMGWEHVIPQLIKKIMEASDSLKKKQIDLNIQGSGNETRAFCYVDDAVSGIIYCSKFGEAGEIYNIGTLDEISISKLVKLISEVLEMEINIIPGEIMSGSPDRRCPDITKIQKLGYNPEISIKAGLEKTIKWYVDSIMSN